MRLRLWWLNQLNRQWVYNLRYHPATQWIERVIYCHHNARVIADFEDRMCFVLWSCTKGMSKPYYDKHAMVAEINAWCEDACDDAVKEALEAHGITETETA